MKRIILIMATAMMALSASAQQANNKTLYIVDGKVVSEEQAKAIKNEDVDNMNVFEGIESAVIINTKQQQKTDVVVIRGEQKPTVKDANNQVLDEVIFYDSDTNLITHKNPLMLLTDGKKTMKINSVTNISPADILHMTIIDFQSLESAAAEQYKKYGDISNGVTIIQVKDLKKYKK